MLNSGNSGGGPELKKELELFGRKLAVLLHDSNLPDEVKEAIIDLLPDLSLEQIDRLFLILETAYENQETKGIDQKYRKIIKYIAKEFSHDEEVLSAKFKKELEKLEKARPF